MVRPRRRFQNFDVLIRLQVRAMSSIRVPWDSAVPAAAEFRVLTMPSLLSSGIRRV